MWPYLKVRIEQAWRSACQFIRVMLGAFGDCLFLSSIGFFIGLGFSLAAILAIMIGGLFCGKADAAESISRAAHQYRDVLIRSARATWGMEAPVAVFAAQVHTESRWDANAVSPVGARGLAQFMPSTAAWLPDVAPVLRGQAPAPYNPGWALRALCEYDLWLWSRVSAVSACDRMSFVLSSYNGGLGWVQKDQRVARSRGRDPASWQAVAPVNAGRSHAAWTENRDYVRRVMDRQSLYRTWGPGVNCDGS